MITSFGPHSLNHFKVWAEEVWPPDYALAVHG
jgi:hypothetical protein